MTLTDPMQTIAEPSDLVLVTDTLAGDRTAFEQIVARYQTLICSLAYSATGSIPQSEDVAQETFVTAWKHLPHLREQDKLRGWLCGIARFTISKVLRQQRREPSHAAEQLDALAETSTTEALAVERMSSEEEQAIVWRTLEQIPETYREPMVLFYRERQSVEAVARALDLTEDAVKQRLSRGRKLLQGEVMAIVESGLTQTAPGRRFTIGVIAAIPAFMLPAQAAASGTALVAKGGTKAAFGTTGGVVAMLAGPIVAIFGTWLSYRMDLDAAGSAAERELTKRFYRKLTIGLGTLFVAFLMLMVFGRSLREIHPFVLPGLYLVFGVGYAAYIGKLMLWWFRARRTYLIGTRDSAPAIKPAWEYRTRATFLGLPLIHMRIGGDLRANRQAVRAWIAAGDTAFGGLFAFGGIAVAPISIGGCALGLFSFGGASIGALALGGLCVGAWAFGGLALGWQAFGGCAIAWNAAVGGAAIAREFALGGTAIAAHANNEAVKTFLGTQVFFRNAGYIFQHYMAWINLVWVLPLLVWSGVVRRAKAAFPVGARE